MMRKVSVGKTKKLLLANGAFSSLEKEIKRDQMTSYKKLFLTNQLDFFKGKKYLDLRKVVLHETVGSRDYDNALAWIQLYNVDKYEDALLDLHM